MEKKKKPTQCDRIMRHFEKYGSITPNEAASRYGIRRLASRINDLKSRGVAITTEMVKGKNKYNETTRYAKYRLAEEKEN